MSIRDKTRIRKTYGAYRVLPQYENYDPTDPSAPSGKSMLTFNNLTELKAYDLATPHSEGNLDVGVIAFVRSVGDYYVLVDSRSVIEPNKAPFLKDGSLPWFIDFDAASMGQFPIRETYCVDPTIGFDLTGKYHRTDDINVKDVLWKRMMISNYWLEQTTWCIDPNNGDDEALGTESGPIKTLDELSMRLFIPNKQTGLLYDYNVTIINYDEGYPVRCGLGLDIKLNEGSIKFEANSFATLDQKLSFASEANGITGSIYFYKTQELDEEPDPELKYVMPIISSSIAISFDYDKPLILSASLGSRPPIGANPGDEFSFWAWPSRKIVDNPVTIDGSPNPNVVSTKYFTTTSPKWSGLNYDSDELAWPNLNSNSNSYPSQYVTWPSDGEVSIWITNYPEIDIDLINIAGIGTCTFSQLNLRRTPQYTKSLPIIGRAIQDNFDISANGGCTLVFEKCVISNLNGSVYVTNGPVYFDACSIGGAQSNSSDFSHVWFDNAKIGFSTSGIARPPYVISTLMSDELSDTQNSLLLITNSIVEFDDVSLINVDFDVNNSKLSFGYRGDMNSFSAPWHRHHIDEENIYVDDYQTPACLTNCKFVIRENVKIDLGSTFDGSVAIGEESMTQLFDSANSTLYREAMSQTVFEINNINSEIYTPWRGRLFYENEEYETYEMCPNPTGSLVSINEQTIEWRETPYQDSLQNNKIIPGVMTWKVLPLPKLRVERVIT